MSSLGHPNFPKEGRHRCFKNGLGPRLWSKLVMAKLPHVCRLNRAESGSVDLGLKACWNGLERVLPLSVCQVNRRCFCVSRFKPSYPGRQKSTFLQYPRLKNFEGARVPCLFDHLLLKILPRESEEHFKGAAGRFSPSKVRLKSLSLLPRDNQVFSTWAKHQGIRGISTAEKQKKRVGVLEVPSSSFKLMKNSTYLKAQLLEMQLWPCCADDKQSLSNKLKRMRAFWSLYLMVRIFPALDSRYFSRFYIMVIDEYHGTNPFIRESEMSSSSSSRRRRRRRRKERVRWIQHYNNGQKILLVGEGDFSFSACLARAFGSAVNMVATSLHSQGESNER
ncbi:hypothetical protein TEA_016841 [Camellia sinensis var. sinensis]|uniref:25S rRNA (uridine-N(3))-methyltransferase BMT5-like domain-containing protein n=1 Tax=Camellia sinensis var. sinensis TaxID=542762 RepID=A0A4S4CZH6_CAMSN|nr:hypothetical protein TEA_016841 [Camellia sinensis var. sinensis]